MFNNLVLELGTSYAFQGKNFNSCLKRRHYCLSLVRFGLGSRSLESGSFQAPSFSYGVPDGIYGSIDFPATVGRNRLHGFDKRIESTFVVSQVFYTSGLLLQQFLLLVKKG